LKKTNDTKLVSDKCICLFLQCFDERYMASKKNYTPVNSSNRFCFGRHGRGLF